MLISCCHHFTEINRNFLHEMEQSAGNISDSILASDTVCVFISNHSEPLSHHFTNNCG